MMVAFAWLPHFGKSAGMLRIDTDLCHLMRVFYFEKQHRLKTKRSIHSMKKINWKSLLISLALSLGTGVLGSVLSGGGMTQYAERYCPPLSPPGWVFPVVWTVLYILMGIASYLIWESGHTGGKLSGEAASVLTLYLISLGLNLLWPILFFRSETYLLAFADLILLWISIFLIIKRFRPIHETAAKLLLPYLIWVTFAGYLNLAIALYYL